MCSFKQYLEDHNIEPLGLSVVAGVRYITVWNATRGNAIAQDHAQKIRVALQHLTGTVYADTLLMLDEKRGEQIPILPFRKINRNN